MNRNLRIVLLVSILFGAAAGSYELVFPFYLQHLGISFGSMGLIFSFSTAAMFLARVFLGNLSDQLGRKLFYSLSLLFCGVATLVTPALGSVWAFSLSKSVREAAFMTREVLHPVVIYEENRRDFLRLISGIRGAEYLLLAGGTLAAGVAMARLGYSVIFLVSGGMLLVGLAIFSFGFRERAGTARKAENRWRDLVSFDISYNLKVICIASFIFSVGLQCSHSFIMPLFFSDRFGASPGVVSIIMMVHRLALALPLLLMVQVPPRYFKSVYIGFIIYQGASVAVSALIPSLWPSALVWITHDLLGAGFWMPVQNTIIQHYSRDRVRGRDVSKTLTFPALGGVFGPYLAGYLARVDIRLPFLVSGLLTAASALVLFALRLEDLEREASTAGAQPKMSPAPAEATE